MSLSGILGYIERRFALSKLNILLLQIFYYFNHFDNPLSQYTDYVIVKGVAHNAVCTSVRWYRATSAHTQQPCIGVLADTKMQCLWAKTSCTTF